MAKKQEISEEVKAIREALKQKKAVIGAKSTLKKLKLGKLSTVYLSSNCPEDMIKDIGHYGKLAKTSIKQLTHNNEELGVICKKEFLISVLGIKAD
ncbi:MAG: ribosomal L7Ae/L30e/S12e/Gadd45 family protein [archaeon]